jgi:uncharacterized DUF497 family protein
VIYDWDEEKNDFLKHERDISFEEIVLYISEGNVVDILEHPNKEKYPHQKVYLVKIEDYIYAVPFVEDTTNGVIFLKTAYASRKYTRKYKKN